MVAFRTWARNSRILWKRGGIIWIQIMLAMSARALKNEFYLEIQLFRNDIPEHLNTVTMTIQPQISRFILFQQICQNRRNVIVGLYWLHPSHSVTTTSTIIMSWNTFSFSRHNPYNFPTINWEGLWREIPSSTACNLTSASPGWQNVRRLRKVTDSIGHTSPWLWK